MTELAAWKRRTVVLGLLLLFFTVWSAMLHARLTALHLVQSQDLPVLFLASSSMLIIPFWQPGWELPPYPPPRWALVLLGIVVTVLMAWGTYALLGNFPLSRDEHMVVFDMAVFGTGRLAAPLAPEWRPYASALVPEFLLNSNQPIGLVSTYLPVNAMLRLAFSKFADPAWYNPLLVFLGGAALLDVARRTFGPEDRACWAVLLVYVLSAQVLVGAMSDFSMTGHMALNLVWLAAFTRGGKVANAVAIGVGFLATGLHQLVFHPFFVVPFLLWKFRDGNFRIALLYAAAYAAIAAWWFAYPLLISPLVAGPGTHASEGNFLTDRLVPLLLNRNARTVPLMILNLMRFVAWQNLVVGPLLIAALPVAIRERGLARALLLGIVGWLLFVTLVLPEQGRGWGYRYLHGYLGSFALLAGFGYRELKERIGSRADGMLIVLSGLTLVAAIPQLFAASSRSMQPHLAMQRLIAGQRTQFVVIDDTNSTTLDGRWKDTARDHVRNLPDLTNRPLRFSGDELSPSMLIGLCRRGQVTLITRTDMHRQGFILNVPERSPKFEALIAATKREAPICLREAVPVGQVKPA